MYLEIDGEKSELKKEHIFKSIILKLIKMKRSYNEKKI